MSDDALTAELLGGGARFAEVDGRSVPADFGDAAAEYRALHAGAGVVDAAWLDRVVVTGSDRVDFLQGMLSNDIKGLTADSGCPALLLTEQGKVVADLTVLAVPEALMLDGSHLGLEAAARALDRFIVADDVTLAAPEPAERTFAVLGPDAADVLGRLGVPVPTSPFAHATVVIADTPVHVVRVPGPGAGGFECHVPVVAAAAWWRRCLDGGKAVAAGYTAFDVLRIESGRPWFGADVGPETLALEAPYDDAISFRKGCYLGQEVMERVTARGHVNRKLTGLLVDGDVVPSPRTPIYVGEREVGRVTSAAWSWRLERVIALAYVRREHLAAGTALAVGDAPARPATVHQLPF